MRDRLLLRWARLVVAHPRAVLAFIACVTVGALAVVPQLRVEAGHSKLENKNNIHQRRFAKFLNEFGSPNQLFVLAEGGSERLRWHLIDAIGKSLPRPHKDAPPLACDAEGQANHPGCVRDLVGRIDLDALKARALLLVPPEQLRSLVKALTDENFGLKTVASITGLRSMVTALSAELERRADQPLDERATSDQGKQAMALAAKVLREVAARVSDPKRDAVPLEEVLAPTGVQSGVDSRGYLSSGDGAIKLAFILPVNDSDEPSAVVPFVSYVRRHAQAAADTLNASCSATKGACPDGPLTVTLTGLPAIVADETAVVGDDVLLTSVAATIGILIVFYLGFRSMRQTILGLLPLLIGLIWTLAFVRLTFDSLNLVTSAFIVTLLGLGIDFAVHLMSRFNEQLRQGAEQREATVAAVMGAGPGILTGALTTSGAFVALAASRFMAFSQLGIITGVGLVFVLLCTFTVLPALLVGKLGRAAPASGGVQGPARPLFGLSDLVVKRYRLFVVAGLLISAAMLVTAQQIPWSYNYMELMPQELPSVQAMERLAKRTDFSAETVAVIAKSAAQARAHVKALEAKKTVGRVESAISYIPKDQAAKTNEMAPLKGLLKGLERKPEEPFDLAGLSAALEELTDTLEDLQFEAKRGNAKEQAALLDPPIKALAELRAAITKQDPKVAANYLKKLQKMALDGVDKGLALLRSNVMGGTVDVETMLASLPDNLRDRLYANGKFAIYVYPSQPIWEKAFMGKLIADIRSVDPEATGFPVTHWEISNAIERGFRDASFIACAMLLLLLLVDFRSLRYALLATAPLGMGIAWMWGGISLIGMSYNFANVIAFPLIIGIGVASGVHILHRYRQEGEADVATVVRFTGMAVLLSAATTMVGFGSLSIAGHRGAASLGIVLLMGVGACLVTSVCFLPAVLRWLRVQSNRKTK